MGPLRFRNSSGITLTNFYRRGIVLQKASRDVEKKIEKKKKEKETIRPSAVRRSNASPI
jgi:hypothetical protein